MSVTRFNLAISPSWQNGIILKMKIVIYPLKFQKNVERKTLILVIKQQI